MADDAVLSFTLESPDGAPVPFDTLAHAFSRFRELIESLGKDVARGIPLKWGIEELRKGSAKLELRPTVTDNFAVEHGARQVAGALRDLTERGVSGTLGGSPYSRTTVNAFYRLTYLVDEDVPAMALGTRNNTVRVTLLTALHAPTSRMSFGSMSGVLEAPDEHRIGDARFVLYDDVFDHPVICFLKDGDVQTGLEPLWKKRVRVTGVISSDRETGMPKSMRHIERIDVIPPSTADSTNTFGAWAGWHSTVEERIEALRRVRRGE